MAAKPNALDHSLSKRDFTIITIAILAIVGLMCLVAWHIDRPQKVTFINTKPIVTTLGLAKFEVNKDSKPIDYEVLNIRWNYEIRTINLSPGLYGVTQCISEFGMIISYLNFWVKDKPLTVKL